MKLSWKALGLVGAGAGAWVFVRLRARKKLTELLYASPQVMAALEGGFITWMPEDKAAQMIRLDNVMGPQVAFTSALTEVRVAMPPEAELQLAADAQRLVEDKLIEMGMTEEQIESTKAEAASLYQSLPDVPYIDTSRWLPTWVTGEEG